MYAYYCHDFRNGGSLRNGSEVDAAIFVIETVSKFILNLHDSWFILPLVSFMLVESVTKRPCSGVNHFDPLVQIPEVNSATQK